MPLPATHRDLRAEVATGRLPGARSTPAPPSPTGAKIAGALKRFAGSVSAAARDLGVHRTQLRRWMDRHGIDARTFGAPSRATTERPGRGRMPRVTAVQGC